MTWWESFVVELARFFRGAEVAAGVSVPYDKLPDPPTPEPPADTSLGSLRPDLVPVFQDLENRLSVTLAAVGWGLRRLETRRNDTRQGWLWGVGRLYKAPGRDGIVTDVKTARGPHGEGRAVDYAYVPYSPGTSPSEADLNTALASVAAETGLTWGGQFHLSSGDTDPAHWESA